MTLRFPNATAEVAQAWATTIRRTVVVRFRFNGAMLCAASLHCCESEGTADLIRMLKDVVMESIGEAIVFVGLDSNVKGKNAGEFQTKLRESGMAIGHRSVQRSLK